jgi:hypothetical protein
LHLGGGSVEQVMGTGVRARGLGRIRCGCLEARRPKVRFRPFVGRSGALQCFAETHPV